MSANQPTSPERVREVCHRYFVCARAGIQRSEEAGTTGDQRSSRVCGSSTLFASADGPGVRREGPLLAPAWCPRPGPALRRDSGPTEAPHPESSTQPRLKLAVPQQKRGGTRARRARPRPLDHPASPAPPRRPLPGPPPNPPRASWRGAAPPAEPGPGRGATPSGGGLPRVGAAWNPWSSWPRSGAPGRALSAPPVRAGHPGPSGPCPPHRKPTRSVSGPAQPPASGARTASVGPCAWGAVRWIPRSAPPSRHRTPRSALPAMAGRRHN